MALTDKQLEWVFGHRLGHANGRGCSQVFYSEAGVREGVCPAKAKIINGRLQVSETCGNVCYYWERLAKFRDILQLLQQYDKAACEAREAEPSP